MRNVSNEYREKMKQRRDFYATAEIEFQDGTKKQLTKKDFTTSGNTIVTSPNSSSFPLGYFVARQITLSLINTNDEWADYDFFGAKIRLFTSFQTNDTPAIPDEEFIPVVENLREGIFTVITPETYGTVIEITAMDDSYLSDIEYTSTLAFPLRVDEALRDCCSTCGITLYSSDFLNNDFEIQTKPENITCRQFIGYCAMIACGNAVMDDLNRVKIISYDFTPFETENNPEIPILQEFKTGLKLSVDDVVITGIQIKGKNEQGEDTVIQYGESGYMLALENPLAVGKENEFANIVGSQIVGVKFRPFTGDNIADPLPEFMDNVYVKDYKGKIYQSVITDVDFTYFGFTVLKCSADSPIRNSSKYYEAATQAIVEARKLVTEEKTEREKAVERLNELINNIIIEGGGGGIYITKETLPDGSEIVYIHDQPTLDVSSTVIKITGSAIGISNDGGETYIYGLTFDGEAILRLIYAEGIDADYITAGSLSADRIQGGTLRLGGLNNENGKLEIIDANGEVIGYWDNTGIELIKGTIGGLKLKNGVLYSGTPAIDKYDYYSGSYIGLDQYCNNYYKSIGLTKAGRNARIAYNAYSSDDYAKGLQIEDGKTYDCIYTCNGLVSRPFHIDGTAIWEKIREYQEQGSIPKTYTSSDGTERYIDFKLCMSMYGIYPTQINFDTVSGGWSDWGSGTQYCWYSPLCYQLSWKYDENSTYRNGQTLAANIDYLLQWRSSSFNPYYCTEMTSLIDDSKRSQSNSSTNYDLYKWENVSKYFNYLYFWVDDTDDNLTKFREMLFDPNIPKYQTFTMLRTANPHPVVPSIKEEYPDLDDNLVNNIDRYGGRGSNAGYYPYVYASGGTGVDVWDVTNIYQENGYESGSSGRWKFAIDYTGKTYAREGEFSGNLKAASGTFAGELQAAKGTFAGALSAATGTFKGELTTGDIQYSTGFRIADGRIYGYKQGNQTSFFSANATLVDIPSIMLSSYGGIAFHGARIGVKDSYTEPATSSTVEIGGNGTIDVVTGASIVDGNLQLSYKTLKFTNGICTTAISGNEAKTDLNTLKKIFNIYATYEFPDDIINIDPVFQTVGLSYSNKYLTREIKCYAVMSPEEYKKINQFYYSDVSDRGKHYFGYGFPNPDLLAGEELGIAAEWDSSPYGTPEPIYCLIYIKQNNSVSQVIPIGNIDFEYIMKLQDDEGNWKSYPYNIDLDITAPRIISIDRINGEYYFRVSGQNGICKGGTSYGSYQITPEEAWYRPIISNFIEDKGAIPNNEDYIIIHQPKKLNLQNTSKSFFANNYLFTFAQQEQAEIFRNWFLSN